MIQLFKPYINPDAIEAVRKTLESGWIGLGPKTLEFEEKFAEYVGAKYAVAVNSSTSALHLAVIVSGIQAGDEVITTPLTFISTNQVMLYQGAVPVFCDVDENTLNLDLKKARLLVTAKTKAIMVVHYGGNPLPINELYEFANEHKLQVIEDAAHACGARCHGKAIGSFGLTCFSFHAVKNLPIGDGGMITTQDKSIYDRLQSLRWMGIDRSTFARTDSKQYQWEYEVNSVGYKYHMNDIAATLGLSQLTFIEQWNDRRREIANIYRERLGKPNSKVRLLEATPDSLNAQHLFVVRVPDRNAVVDKLKDKAVSVGVHYKPNHFYPPFKNCPKGDLSVCEQITEEIISLPLHLFLTDKEVHYVCDSLLQILDA